MAFKITNLAKDLGIKSKEITELLTARGVECKTTQKTLEPAEFDLVFEQLTRASQVSNIDDYLFGDTYIPTVAPAKKESKKPEAEKSAPEVAAAPTKAEPVKEAAPEAPAKEEKAKAPAPKAKEEKKAEQEMAAPEVKSAPKTEAAAQSPAPAPAKEPEKRPAQSPRTYNIPQNLRATMQQRPAAPAARPQNTRPQGDRPQGAPTGNRPQGQQQSF
ncbi:MAG: hypothetical protein J6U87_00570, partial [Clostridia bacterium]|nr:hypothetical protein [Clostridia bacterium]